LKKRDDKIIFGLSEKPDKENRLFFKMQFSKIFAPETDSRSLIRTAGRSGSPTHSAEAEKRRYPIRPYRPQLPYRV